MLICLIDYGVNVCDIMEIREQFIVKWALLPLLSHNIIQVKSNLDEIIILFRSDLSENQVLHTIELIRKGINKKFLGYPNLRFYCRRTDLFEKI